LMISCHGLGRAHRTALSVSRRDLRRATLDSNLI
jgi:hypothetical protein